MTICGSFFFQLLHKLTTPDAHYCQDMFLIPSALLENNWGMWPIQKDVIECFQVMMSNYAFSAIFLVEVSIFTEFSDQFVKAAPPKYTFSSQTAILDLFCILEVVFVG